MSLTKYINDNLITERLKITSNTRSATLTPKSKDELITIIKQELERQGPDADLNHIDVSEIRDMSTLFVHLKIKNIKIDSWDVSNVTNMDNMFHNCYEFNSDLSRWDVSNVTSMKSMLNYCNFLNLIYLNGTYLM